MPSELNMPPPIQTGHLDSYGHPAIKIAVYGVAEAAQQQFEAIIDTGFTGFLMMPLSSAYSLTLTLMGTANYELADGSICSKLLAHGSVTLEDEVVSGVITLEERNDCVLLLGMDFLRKAQRALWVHESGMSLVHDDFVDQLNRTLTAIHDKYS